MNHHLESKIFKPYEFFHDSYFPNEVMVNPVVVEKFENYWKIIENEMIERINHSLHTSLFDISTAAEQLRDHLDWVIKNLFQQGSDYGKNINFSIQNIIDFLMFKIFDLKNKNKLFEFQDDERSTLNINAYAYQIRSNESDLIECIIYDIEFDILNVKKRMRWFEPVCVLRDQMFVSTCVQLHNIINPGYFTTGQAVSEVPVVETRMFNDQYFTKES